MSVKLPKPDALPDATVSRDAEEFAFIKSAGVYEPAMSKFKVCAIVITGLIILGPVAGCVYEQKERAFREMSRSAPPPQHSKLQPA